MGIVALFALCGPPVGAVTVALCLSAMAAAPGLNAAGWHEAVKLFAVGSAFSFVFGLPLAYLTGIVPAALVGMAVAARERRTGLISMPVAVSSALLLGVLAASRIGGLTGEDGGARLSQGAVMLAHLAAAVLCARLARAVPGAVAGPGRPRSGTHH